MSYFSEMIKTERTSNKRYVIKRMLEIFKELNEIPHEKRKHWGSFGHWSKYDFAIEFLEKEEQRLDANLARVKRCKK